MTEQEMSGSEIIDSLYKVDGFRLHVMESPGENEYLWRILFKNKVVADGSVSKAEIQKA